MENFKPNSTVKVLVKDDEKEMHGFLRKHASCLLEYVAEYKAGCLRSLDHGRELMAFCNS